MGRDWKRLAEAIRTAREERNLTQVEVADAADVSESTVQNLESGIDRTRLPPSLAKIEPVIGWAPGSGKTVLEGGEPTRVPMAVVDAAAPAARDNQAAVSDLPLRIVQELADGPLLDTQVMDLTPLGSSARMIVVVKGETDASPEQIRRDLLAWARAQERLQTLGDDDDPTALVNEG
ncbi:helix-turn-helix domain-containing protein [Streptomyces sp. Ac-502]|uniref:helix-turn-helix domain-containing protein n=1 Tax=Streptomyces sp. Ac-502 TaxID=3342801 RepID=UPI003862AE41